MTQQELITYFDEEIMIKTSKYNAMMNNIVGNILNAKNDLMGVSKNCGKLVNADLYNLQNALALNKEEQEKLEAYSFFMSTKYFKLDDAQEEYVKRKSLEYIQMLEKDIKTVIMFHPEIEKLQEIINTLKECRGMLLDEDFTLDDYIDVSNKLQLFELETKKLSLCLAKYMNNMLIRNNNQRMSHLWLFSFVKNGNYSKKEN